MKEIESRRSIRKFEDREIPRETIDKILTAGINAPSAKNRQPWKFTVLTGAAKAQAVKAMRQGIARERETGGLLPLSRIFLSGAAHTADIMEEAPMLIMITNPAGKALQESLTPEERLFERADIQSVGAAIENMILEAESLGVGSLWICDIFFAYKELSELFGGSGELMAALSLGYAAEAPHARPRKPFDETVTYME